MSTTSESEAPKATTGGPEAHEDINTGDPVFAVNTTRGFTTWLKQQRASLAVTTYQVGKVLFFGCQPDGKLWVFNRTIGRCLGVAMQAKDLWVTGDTQVFRFVDAMEDGQRSSEGHDALYVPQVAYFTGDLDIHDMAVTADGRLVFVNTLFNCLATISPTHSFIPVWNPPFITRMAAEDRCHLNGLALRDGKPAYATAVSQSDTFDGWRDHRQDGGIVIDIENNQIVCDGLSMPHSPRWYGGKLWLHNSGTGEFGWVDLASGKFHALSFVPGYLRGLDFIGDNAVMGLSKPRDNKTFTGLALDQNLSSRRIQPRCGIYVINLQSGDVLHSLTIEGLVSELYDVAVIPGKSQPSAIGLSGHGSRRTISIGAPE